MWLRHINICIEYTWLTVYHFWHFQFLILVLWHEVTVWSCRKENVNRYSERILLVSGLWIYGTSLPEEIVSIQLWTVWRIDLIGTVSISDTVITEISSFNDQSRPFWPILDCIPTTNIEDRPMTDLRSWKSLPRRTSNGYISMTVPNRRGDNFQ